MRPWQAWLGPGGRGPAMKDDRPGLTIIARCSGGLRLVSDRVRSFEWESYPRREPRPPRERLRGLAPWRPTPNDAKPSNNSELESGEDDLIKFLTNKIRQTGLEAVTF